MRLANLLSIKSQTQYHHHCYHWHGMVIMIIIDATPWLVFSFHHHYHFDHHYPKMTCGPPPDVERQSPSSSFLEDCSYSFFSSGYRHHHHHHCLNIVDATMNIWCLVFPDSDVGKPQVAHTTPGQNKKHSIETEVILSKSFVKSMKHSNPHLMTPRLWRDQVTDSNTISFPGQSKHMSPFCGASDDCWLSNIATVGPPQIQ